MKPQTPGRGRSAKARASDVHEARDSVAVERSTRSAKRQKLCHSSSVAGVKGGMRSPSAAASQGHQGLDKRHYQDRSVLAASTALYFRSERQPLLRMVPV